MLLTMDNTKLSTGMFGIGELSLSPIQSGPAFTFYAISTQIISGLLSTKEGTSVTVAWGDGTSNTYSGTDQAYSKDYGSVGNRTVVFAPA